jgi:hypothetical protein
MVIKEVIDPNKSFEIFEHLHAQKIKLYKLNSDLSDSFRIVAPNECSGSSGEMCGSI